MENVLRKQMVAEAIGRAGPPPYEIEFVSKFLPEDFELGADDLAPYASVEETEPAPQAEAQPFDWGALGEQVDALRANRLQTEIEQPAAEPEAPAVQPGDIEAAIARRVAADSLVNNARVTLIVAQNAEKDSRIKLADAVVQFQSGFEKLTPQDLRVAFVKEQAAIRKAQAEGTLPLPLRGQGIGKSVVDRTAFYGRGGNPATGNYRRNAFPSQAQGTKNYDPRHGPVAKPPSVR